MEAKEEHTILLRMPMEAVAWEVSRSIIRLYIPTRSIMIGDTDGRHTGYSVREELPLPDKPPYTVHLGNLSFDATIGDVTDFFTGCECTNVRIIEDKLEMKPKGFGYAEFATLDGLKQALTLNGTQFQGRNIRISVADPRKSQQVSNPLYHFALTPLPCS
jgi:RNA recognition motif-containing protein